MNRPQTLPLIFLFLLQVTGLVVYASVALPNVFPKGGYEALDWVYHHSYFWAGQVLLLALWVWFTLHRLQPTRLIIFGLIGFALLVAMSEFWFALVLLFPLLADSQDKEEPNGQGAPIFFGGFLLGSFALMTQEVPFPHILPHETFYVWSLSLVMLVFWGGGFLLLANLIKYGFGFIVPNSLKNHSSALALILTLYGYFWFGFEHFYRPIVIEFGLTAMPWISAGVATGFFMLLWNPIMAGKGFFWRYMFGSAHKNWFWAQFIILFIFVRQVFTWFVATEQNFIAVILYDAAKLTFPVLCLWVGFGLTNKLLVNYKNHLLGPIMGFATVLLLAVSPIYYKKTWTVTLESNRPLAQFVAARGRQIFTWIGMSPYKEGQEVVKLFYNEAKKPSLTDLKQLFGVANKPSKTLGRPHLFIFISDATYAGRTTPYGYKHDTTPNLAAFARDAKSFQNFYSNSSATSNSLFTLFSGFYKGNSRVPPNLKTNGLCALFEKLGYQIILSDTLKPFAMETFHCKSATFVKFNGRNPEAEGQDWKIVQKALQGDKPVFYYSHVYGGHDPWKLKSGDKSFGSRKLDIYDSLLYKADQQFGRLINRIKKANIYDQSIIIHTADHGIGLGHHMDQVSYSNVYDVNLKIPFTIKTPGITPGKITSFHSLIDVTPTLYQLLGQESDRGFFGVGFGSVIVGKPLTQSNCVFASATYTDQFAITCPDGKKVIFNRNLSMVFFYDLKSDPFELQPIKTNPKAGSPFFKLAQYVALGKNSFTKKK